ncbi:LPP20 family lipoprotein [Plebeiibacterium sediminum]|uniref:LPP20 family lipoprotein n=1 Tax=Plebeiibacterium sediminum TaxID=2992112 RepID=A0AAE3SGF7_9BACT|nr:LPP20 family lipoprotein [Plebeiobacterium sediminum]MCW3788042.1 LPP20 family lipoprotein [Plebeiobacterium sediminum]
MNYFFNPKSIRWQFIILIVLPILFSSISVEAKKKPDWVKQRPNDSSYYIGIANAIKHEGEVTYRTETRNKALKQLSSEIKVNISSNSILHQFEDNYQVKEQFESKTYESIEATLEGYEVFTWENNKEYWVMMRLSKEKYALNKKLKLDNAKKISATYYYSGKKAVDNGEIYQGLLTYIQAIKAIKNHVGEDLSYKDIDGSLNLGVDIFNGIQEGLKKINLEPGKDAYTVQFSKELTVPLSLQAFYFNKTGEKTPIANLPLQFSFTKGEGDLSSSGLTNNNGEANCDVNRFISKRKSQEITAKFDANKLYNSEDDETKVLLHAFFYDEFLPSARFNIELQKSSAYLILNEVVFGETPNTKTFSNMMRAELAQSYFNITNDKNNADFIVKINSNFIAGDEKKGKGYALYIVFVEFNLSIIDNKTQMEIFADGFSDLKGMLPGSYEHALKNARQKAENKIIEDILPKMEQVNL